MPALSKIPRKSLIAIGVSAAALVSIVTYEGYSPTAYTPVPGDKLTLGFGTAEGVRPGDVTTPTVALARALTDINKFDTALKQCVKVPLHQYEHSAYISFSYNVGSGAFCKSTLVKKLNQLDYAGACLELRKWVKFKGKTLAGLVKRREAEYRTCIGEGAE